MTLTLTNPRGSRKHLTVRCRKCRHTQTVEGSRVGSHYIYGSRADFCDKCDGPCRPVKVEPPFRCAGCDKWRPSTGKPIYRRYGLLNPAVPARTVRARTKIQICRRCAERIENERLTPAARRALRLLDEASAAIAEVVERQWPTDHEARLGLRIIDTLNLGRDLFPAFRSKYWR